MVQLYVANCTTQNMQFSYREPEKQDPVTVSLRPGQQSPLPSVGLSKEILTTIAEAHRQFGWVHAQELHKTKTRIQACFDYKEIDPQLMSEAIRLNNFLAENRSMKIVRDGLLAADATLREVTGGKLSVDSVKVSEVTADGSKPHEMEFNIGDRNREDLNRKKGSRKVA